MCFRETLKLSINNVLNLFMILGVVLFVLFLDELLSKCLELIA